jgi:hypothetical protein
MAQLKKVVEPFGEVNVFPAGSGRVRVRATILMEPRREGTQTGIALDGSGSMSEYYGVNPVGGLLSSVFGRQPAPPNVITPIAQRLCAYLARTIDADGGTTCIYWATGPGGSQVEEIGDLTADQAERHTFKAPSKFGTGTQILPAVKYFVERFADAPWGFYVFITDGELHDLDEVKAYSRQLARAVASGQRRPLKFVLVGVGRDVNEKQMEELDDLDTGTNVDLWDHKLSAEMRQLQQIFAEVVEKNARVADRGKILDPQGRTLRDYADTGVPALLEFEAPTSAAYFTLEAAGNRIHQGLSDSANVPASELASAAVATPVAEEEIPVAEAVEDDEVRPMPDDGVQIDLSKIDLKEETQQIDISFDPDAKKVDPHI